MKPTTESTITTRTGRVLTEADIERLADEAFSEMPVADLGSAHFLREFKGGYESDIVGPMFAISLDHDLDERLSTTASQLQLRPATLMRRAIMEFLDHPLPFSCSEAEADLSEWQWLVHLDADLAARTQASAAAANCHLNVFVNMAVCRLLDSLAA